MANDTTALDHIIDAALTLAADRPWAEITLRDIAHEAELDLADMRDLAVSKDDIIAAFVHRIDKQMLAEGGGVPADQSPRDALFEVIMNRFDALGPYKRALKSIVGPKIPDPDLVKALLQSQAWMLQAAGIEAEGLKGGVRIVGLISVYGSVFQNWLEDDDPGLARTMAVLDRRLRRGERALKQADSLIGTVEGLCKSVLSLWPSRAEPKADVSAQTEGEAKTQL